VRLKLLWLLLLLLLGVLLLLWLLQGATLLVCEALGPASVPAEQQFQQDACCGIAVAVAGHQDVIQQASMKH
jgi:hypothetical protein